MERITFEEFAWYTPKPKWNLAVTIPNQDYLNLNPKLLPQMPARIEIGITADGQKLCIREAGAAGYRVPKSGSIKDTALIAQLVSAGVRLPARYAVERAEGGWLGSLLTPCAPKVSAKRQARHLSQATTDSLKKELTGHG